MTDCSPSFDRATRMIDLISKGALNSFISFNVLLERRETVFIVPRRCVKFNTGRFIWLTPRYRAKYT